MEPKLRFKEFSGDWEENSISNLCEIIDGDRGKNYPKEKDFLEEGHCLFLNAKNVTKEGFKFDEKMFISEEKDNLMKKGKLQINDLVITSRGTIGNVAYFSEFIPYKDIRINSGMLIIRPHKILPIYLYEAMKSLSFEKQIKLITSGNAQPQLTLANFNKLKINYSSLPEQIKIVDFLSTVDEKIQNQQDKITHLENIKKGFMQKIFSRKIRFKDANGNEFPEWEEKKIGEVIEYITDYVAAGSFADIKKNVTYLDKGYAQLIRTIDLKNNFQNKEFIYIDKHAFEYLYKANLNEQSIILPNIGANIGESYYVEPSKLPYKYNVLAPNAILLRSKSQNNKFIYQFFKTNTFINKLKLIVGASGQPKFNKTDLKSLKFELPCLEEQQKIADFLSSFDEKIDAEKETLEHLKELKKGLLQQMFV